jgi:hypothetical protein
MPLRIAKYGLCKMEDNQIIIAGGLIVENSASITSLKGNNQNN